MKILFIIPQIPFNEKPSPAGSYAWIRMGVAHLSAALREQGHITSLLDFKYIEGWNDIIPIVSLEQPDIIATTAITYEKNNAIKTGQMIRQALPDIPQVIGGFHASIAPEDYVQAGCFDYILRGEGEITLPKIVNGVIPKGTHWGEPPDLDTIPFMHRGLWPDYEQIINTETFLRLPLPRIQMFSTRGCPGSCRFCSGPGEKSHFTHEVNGKRVPFIRGRSVENVIREMMELDDRYHYHSYQFMDDQFIMNRKWVEQYCDALKENGLDQKRWWAASRVDLVLRNKDLLLKMQEVGLDTVNVGFESFSDHLLKFWGKGITAQMNYDAADFLNDAGIHIMSNTIFGAPREDGKWYIEDDVANLEAVRKIQPYFASRTVFNPILGSELYQWCKDRDLISPTASGAHIDFIRGVNIRKVRVMMDEVGLFRPIYHNWYDRMMLALGIEYKQE